jgi:hypothetical protein
VILIVSKSTLNGQEEKQAKKKKKKKKKKTQTERISTSNTLFDFPGNGWIGTKGPTMVGVLVGACVGGAAVGT